MIRVGIVGTGNIAHSHVKAYLRFPDRCKVVALADIYPEKAKAFDEQYELGAAVRDSHAALLEGGGIDLVSVCTPPYTHAPIALDCLRAGAHTIVEKPMAASLEECDRLVEAAASSARVFSPIAQNRFRTPMMRLKRLIDSGLAGKVNHVQADSHWWRGHCYYDLWWRGTWEKEGGGCTLNHAVHHIDLLNWLMGMPVELSAFMANTAHDNAEVEDLSLAVMRFEGGALGHIVNSVVHHGEEQQLVFQAESARISVPFRAYASTSLGNGFPQRNAELEKELEEYYEAMPALAHEAHDGQIDDVLTAIETGGAPLIKAEDGRRTLQVIAGIYKSAATRAIASLPIAKGDAFYTAEGLYAAVPRFYRKAASKLELSGESITTGSDYGRIYSYGRADRPK
jgi:UDP-N-acetyl-2-amino-2-deoxyglucuronate dehydrogenase